MDYILEKNKIIIEKPFDFNIKHICECGQMFRFEDKNTHFAVMSSNFNAMVYENDKKSVIIESENIKYYENYFDLKNDYGIIKAELIKNQILKNAIDFGYGIRIAKQDLLETLISFIISANNNIGRIKRTLNLLCQNYGENMGDHFAFPTLSELKKINQDEWKQMGAGYRANYLCDTISKLDEKFLENLKTLSTLEAYDELIKLKGIGNKVCECILLFGLQKTNVFPVDVWMDRVCQHYFNLTSGTRESKSKTMVERFGNLAGYAQQYLFYYKREHKEI